MATHYRKKPTKDPLNLVFKGTSLHGVFFFFFLIYIWYGFVFVIITLEI